MSAGYRSPGTGRTRNAEIMKSPLVMNYHVSRSADLEIISYLLILIHLHLNFFLLLLQNHLQIFWLHRPKKLQLPYSPIFSLLTLASRIFFPNRLQPVPNTDFKKRFSIRRFSVFSLSISLAFGIFSFVAVLPVPYLFHKLHGYYTTPPNYHTIWTCSKNGERRVYYTTPAL